VEEGDYYGAALALGSADVTLWQLVNAYRTLANGGKYSELRLTNGADTQKSMQVYSSEASFVISDILSDRASRSTTFGLENSLGTRYWSAVKTGTSKDMRDNWCIGFTDRYTIGVWVGNFDGSPMRDVSGVTGAAPVWMELVDFLHRHSASVPPPKPESVVPRQVEYENGIEAAREEFFVAGTQASMIAAKPAATARAGIAYPGNGTIIAIDPDMPAAVQRVRFLAAPQLAGQRWQLDGEVLGAPEEPVFWAPRPGHHDLVLIDAGGAELDRVRFEVRGAARSHDSASQARVATERS
jgi:penicillin-binding protein 1C